MKHTTHNVYCTYSHSYILYIQCSTVLLTATFYFRSCCSWFLCWDRQWAWGPEKDLAMFWTLMRMPHHGTLTRFFDFSTLYLNAAEVILAILLEAQEAPGKNSCDAHRATPVGTWSWQVQKHTLKREACPVMESGWGQPRGLSIIASHWEWYLLPPTTSTSQD